MRAGVLADGAVHSDAEALYHCRPGWSPEKAVLLWDITGENKWGPYNAAMRSWLGDSRVDAVAKVTDALAAATTGAVRDALHEIEGRLSDGDMPGVVLEEATAEEADRVRAEERDVQLRRIADAVREKRGTKTGKPE
eukprot:gene25183-28302_t